MANFQHPFQRFQYVKRQSQGLSDVLVASAGRHLYSYAAVDGQRLDVWPQHVAESSSEGQTPPEKKRKLSDDSEGSKEKDISNSKPTWSNIPLVAVSSNGKYLVILTAEDKAIRVLELKTDGKLQELSSRTMPKRPSALALTPDDQTILVGDKFGDGYSMPLIPGEYVKATTKKELQLQAPAATNLTVHTKRNLESLEQQKREQQKRESAPGEPPKEKTSLDFEHQVILGHMSVLTDLVSVSLSGRNYVLTADRDEHIRVSRGIPQVHVIEHYCLGHTSLISKLCIPSWAPSVLVSGDADGQLFLWSWAEGQVLQQISLRDILKTPDIMVRGVQDVVLGATEKIIVVSLEGSSQVLCFTLEENSLKFQGTVQLSGNVLDVVGDDASGSVIVSVDAVREVGSTNTWRSSPDTPQTLIQSFEARPGQSGLQFTLSDSPLAASINSSGTSELSASLEAKKRKEIDDSMYILANLKKKKWDE